MKARPTTDYAKSALFNILEHQLDFESMEVLDLFCGTGSIGFEFISRGAAKVIAVDQDTTSVKFCNDFAKKLEIQKQYVCYRNDCIRALKQVDQPMDLVFCDPPYTFPDHRKLISQVFANDVLKPDGILIVEHGVKTKLDEEPFFTEVRKYGNIFFSFFQKPV